MFPFLFIRTTRGREPPFIARHPYRFHRPPFVQSITRPANAAALRTRGSAAPNFRLSPAGLPSRLRPARCRALTFSICLCSYLSSLNYYLSSIYVLLQTGKQASRPPPRWGEGRDETNGCASRNYKNPHSFNKALISASVMLLRSALS